jgi:hypothetical protein
MTSYTGNLTEQEKVEFRKSLGRLSYLHMMADIIQAKAVEEINAINTLVKPREIMYPDNFYVTKDSELLESLENLDVLRNEYGEDNSLYQGLYKGFADCVREFIGIDSVISMGADTKAGIVFIFEYPSIKATDEVQYFKTGWDEKLNRPYLIL